MTQQESQFSASNRWMTRAIGERLRQLLDNEEGSLPEHWRSLLERIESARAERRRSLDPKTSIFERDVSAPDNAFYLKQAQDCSALAAQFEGELRCHWLKVAEDWEALAVLTDKVVQTVR